MAKGCQRSRTALQMKGSMNDKFVLRTVPKICMPQYAVVELSGDYTGEDVAWFFKHKDARDYILTRNGHSERSRRGRTKGTA